MPLFKNRQVTGMARKKKLAPEQELLQWRGCRAESIERWGEIKMNGCGDPAWTDGQNMNLVKNHITYYRLKIYEVCLANGIPYPPEYCLPLPPEAPAGYMASMDQADRVERLRGYGHVLTTEWKGERYGEKA